MASQFKTFTSGAVLTAAEVNAYLMKQSNIQCDSSADYPSAPTEGMKVYDKALDCELVYTGAAWKRTSAIMQSTAVQEWTPAVTQSGSVSYNSTAGQFEARYIQQGCLITAWCSLYITGTGTAGNAIYVTLPVASSGHLNTAVIAQAPVIGHGEVSDGATTYTCAVMLRASNAVGFRSSSTAASSEVGASPSFSLSSLDTVRFQVQYTVA